MLNLLKRQKTRNLQQRPSENKRENGAVMQKNVLFTTQFPFSDTTEQASAQKN
jgi:hypothetical protein